MGENYVIPTIPGRTVYIQPGRRDIAAAAAAATENHGASRRHRHERAAPADTTTTATAKTATPALGKRRLETDEQRDARESAWLNQHHYIPIWLRKKIDEHIIEAAVMTAEKEAEAEVEAFEYGRYEYGGYEGGDEREASFEYGGYEGDEEREGRFEYGGYEGHEEEHEEPEGYEH
jgi:hypothetical protein